MNRPNAEPQNVSYIPCNVAGTAIAKKYNEIRYFGYRLANAMKYPAIPHHIACRKGRLVSLAMFMKNADV